MLKTKDIISYKTKYEKKHYRIFKLMIDKERDKNIISWLESKDKISQYLKKLVIEDMEKDSD